MLPINDYQKVLYTCLKSTNYKVFDEVPTDEAMPLVVISDYVLSCGNVKNECYIFNQKIDIYSEYEGKKEINEMLSNVFNAIQMMSNIAINDSYFVSCIGLIESPVSRHEDGFYVANLNLTIEIEEEI